MDDSASRRRSTTPITTRAKPSMYGSYSTMLVPEPILPWEEDIRCSQSSYAPGPMTVRSPPFTPFASVFSSTDNHTNPSSIRPCNNWGTHSLKERCYSSDTSLRSFRRLDRKSSTHAMKSNTPSKLKCWPAAPSPPPDKPWTPLSNISSKPELTTLSTRFYFAKPFGMSEMTRQWSTRETTFIANYKQEDDRRHQTRPARVLRLPTWPVSWKGSTTHLCVTCTTNHLSKMEETTMGTVSEVAVFTP